MPNYLCKCCDFQTKLKGDYKRHLKTKKHEVMFFLSTKNNNCQQFDNNLSTICQHKNMENINANIVISVLNIDKACIVILSIIVRKVTMKEYKNM